LGFEQTPLEGLQVPAVWHWSRAVQVTGVPVQVPAWQASAVVQALPSLQAVPFVFAGFEQTPVEGLQVPAVWHWSRAVHVTGLPPVQVPDWQLSPWVQALPSLQAVPLVFAGFEQRPVEVLQVPTTWHWSWAVQVTGVPPVQAPDWQVSVWVQALPSLQVVPLVFGEQVPTRPVRLQAEHWSVQAVSQQTPLTQKPVVHWLLEVHPSPDEPS
jgi:hypothetical protein